MAISIKWDLKIDRESITNRIAKRHAEAIWKTILAVVSYLGLPLYFIYIFISYPDRLSDFDQLIFTEKYAWIFWVCVLFILFYIREKNKNKKIKSTPPLSEYILHKKEICIDSHFTEELLHIIDLSLKDKRKNYPDQIYPLLLFRRLLSSKQIKILFIRLAVNYNKIQRVINQIIKDFHENNDRFNIKVLFHKAFDIAVRNYRAQVGVLEMMEALVAIDNPVKNILIDLNIREGDVSGVIRWIYESEEIMRKTKEETKYGIKRKRHWRNQLWTSTVTPLLDRVGVDLTHQAYSFYPMIDREEEMKRIFEIIESGEYGIVLIGEKGVGITKIIEGIAQKIISGDVPKSLYDKRMHTLSIGKLLALSQGGRLKDVINQLTYEIKRSGDIILVLEDLPSILSVNTEDAAVVLEQLLLDALENRNIILIGSADHETYKQARGSLISAMQPVEIEEMDSNKTLQILQTMAPYLEYEYGVFITYQALPKIVELSQYIHDYAQPAQSVQILRQVCQIAASQKIKLVSRELVEQELSRMVNLPLSSVSDYESKILINLEKLIYKKYINQKDAVSSIASALRRRRTQVQSGERPIGTFLFLGPTGVGKTYLAKRLAEVYFGSSDKMIRLDMSEYQEPQSIRNLIGAPKGTGSTDEGILIEAVKKNPFSVILLDEFEKAHSDILNIFLQIMEDGRITSSLGITYDFTHTIIIATSNAGAVRLQNMLKEGKSMDEIKEVLKSEELNKYFKPELLNRFDNIIIFKPLDFLQVMAIAKILLDELAERLSEKDIKLEYSEEAVKTLAKEGFNPTQGARPLRRVIQDKIEDEISKLILSRSLKARDKILLKEDLTIEIIPAKHYNL